MRNIAVTIALLALLGGAKCGGDKDASVPVPPSAARPFHSEVAALAVLPVKEGWARIKALLSTLRHDREAFTVPGRSVLDLALELIAQGEYPLLDRAVSWSSGESRGAVLTALMMSDSDQAFKQLVRLAERNPEEVRLAGYREGGLDYLVELVGDQAQAVSERIRAAQEISRFADEDVIPRLLPFSEDPSKPKGPIGGTIGGKNTLGEYVQRTIDYIRSKTAPP